MRKLFYFRQRDEGNAHRIHEKGEEQEYILDFAQPYKPDNYGNPHSIANIYSEEKIISSSKNGKQCLYAKSDA